jgi:outer membrane protein OmpA-like peptidoglycan-associated protein
MKNIGLLLQITIFILLITNTASSNDLDELYPTGNRFSISLYGGTTLSQEGGVWSTIRGNFDVKVGYTPSFGGSLSYSISQPFQLELNIVTGYFEADPEAANQFRNEYIFYTGRFVIYLNNVFQTWRMTDRLNPYIYAGGGKMSYDLMDMATPDRSETASIALAGLGIKFGLTNLIDLFANYEFFIADTDFIDGRRAGHPRDMWGAVHMGITANIGSLSRKHIRWLPRDQIVDQHLISQNNRLAALERAREEFERQIADQNQLSRDLENRLTELKAELDLLAEKLAEKPEETVIRIDSNILFEINSIRLSDQAKALLDQLREALQEHPDVDVRIIGHTDNIGPADYNIELSRQRAASVASYLIDQGIEAERLTVEGFGETEPVATNETEEGRRLNRRVVIELQ